MPPPVAVLAGEAPPPVAVLAGEAPPPVVPAVVLLSPPLVVLAVALLLPLVVPAVAVLLPLAACAALLPWSSPICFTMSLSEAAISAPLSSVSSRLESRCPDIATKAS
jgi:hypothetical protein